MQQELTEVALALDPIRLFQQVEQLQQAVFRSAVNGSPFVPGIPPAPIRVFSVECCPAGNIPAERRVPDPKAWLHRLSREQERRKRVLGWRRTQKDPFEGEWEPIVSWLVAYPERRSGDIFREQQRLSPGRYQPLQIRTRERGMRNIRACLLGTVEDEAPSYGIVESSGQYPYLAMLG